MATTAAAAAACMVFSGGSAYPRRVIESRFFTKQRELPRRASEVRVSSSSSGPIGVGKNEGETIYFDGGAHYGDLAANLLLGFTLVWLPLTLAAVLRAFYVRYRFTNLRVTVISGEERSDFSYDAVKDVRVVPRFVGEWGDVIITLKDGSKVDLRSVPKFREISKYTLAMAEKTKKKTTNKNEPKGF